MEVTPICLKPKHSAFFSTNLEVLLKYLNANTVILAGIAGNICILFTANDAYMRDIGLYVPSDCCVSNEESDNDFALVQMQTILKADIRPSNEMNLENILQEASGQHREKPTSGEPKQFAGLGNVVYGRSCSLGFLPSEYRPSNGATALVRMEDPPVSARSLRV